MSKIDELILQYCPHGTVYKTLGELGKFYGGLTGKSKEDFKDGNAAFITYKNVYSNPALDIHPEDKVRIGIGEKQRTLEYGDVIFTGSSETPDECGISSVVTKTPDEPLYLNSFCFIFRFDDLSIIEPDFAKHLFRSGDLRYQIGKTASGVTRYNVSKKLMEKVSIPVPPLEVQREIVRVLDSFTLLTAELTAEITAELTARKKQYEYYRDYILNSVEAPLMKLKDITHSISSGKNKERLENGKYPVYGSTGIIAYTNTPIYDGDRILVARVGANAGFVHIAEGQYDVSDNTLVLDLNEAVLLDYVYFHLMNMNLNQYAKGGGQPLITGGLLKELSIPVPTKEKQKEILEILNRFYKLSHDIDSGIPAEIEAREKQYSYYRDKLLTFEKVGDIN